MFRAVLPPELTRALDFERATLLPSLFHDDDLHQRRADFLFEVPLAGSDAYLLTLLEHQSSQDPLMAARLLVYAGRALDRFLREHPRARRLPALIPIVLYHGARSWSAPRELFELYSLPDTARDGLRGYLPNLTFFLDDLTRTEDEALGLRPGPLLARLALIVLRHAQELRTATDPAATLRSLSHALSALLHVQERTGLDLVFRYMLEIVELGPEEGQEILLQSLPRRVEEDVVTAADQLRAQGREQGREEGREEGELRGMRRVLLRLLSARFAPLPREVETRVATAPKADLERWTDRVLDATNLDDVLQP